MSNEYINESMDLDNHDSLNTNQQNNAPVTPNEFGHMVTSIEEDYIELQNSKNALEKHKNEYESEILRLKAELDESKNALGWHKEEYESEILRLKAELDESKNSGNVFGKEEYESEILRLKAELEGSKNSGDVLEKHKKESEQKINGLMLKTLEQEIMIMEFRNQVETYHKSFENFKNNEKELKKLQQDKENFESKYTKLKQKLKDKKSEIKSLEKRNNELEDEASNYQSALGVVTNIKMSDDDINHVVQLNEDILSLQDKIDSYVTPLAKSKVDVKIEEITKLLSLYGCQTRIETENPDRQFISAILQRHVLETIFEFTKRYFICSEKDHCYLESDVVKKTDELHELMKTFASTRYGTDEITNFTPIKLRQLIYAALGMRGLGDIVKSDNLCMHDFTAELNDSMNQYRVVTDPKKKEYVDGLAKIIIQEVFRIFYFRLKIQEPIAQYHWFKCGDKVNKTSMDTSWDEDEIDDYDLVVELCTFPLIYQDINSNRKIFTPAKIFTRHVPTEKLQNESLTDNSDQVELTSNNSTEQAEQNVDESSHHSSTNILTDNESNRNYSQENKIQIVNEKQENEEKQQIETSNEGEIH